LKNSDKLAIVVAGSFAAGEENADNALLLKTLSDEAASRCGLIEWSTQPSSYYSMKLTLDMINLCERLVSEDGYGGIVVVAGSAAMEEMAYMCDLLWQREEPVIFANLMIKGRFGSEEGFDNLRGSVAAALSPEAAGRGVLVCSDKKFFAASEVVMVDPYTPDKTFQSPQYGALGEVTGGSVKFFRNPDRPNFLARKPEEPAHVEAVWATMGGGDRIIAALASAAVARSIDGVVLAGMSLGSLPPSWTPHILNILRCRIPAVIVSRCFQGSARESAYFEGSCKKLIEIGVMPGGSLSPYRARIKMSLGIAAGLTQKGLSRYLLGGAVSEDVPEFYK
jgi:L-asparaginase